MFVAPTSYPSFSKEKEPNGQFSPCGGVVTEVVIIVGGRCVSVCVWQGRRDVRRCALHKTDCSIIDYAKHNNMDLRVWGLGSSALL